MLASRKLLKEVLAACCRGFKDFNPNKSNYKTTKLYPTPILERKKKKNTPALPSSRSPLLLAPDPFPLLLLSKSYHTQLRKWSEKVKGKQKMSGNSSSGSGSGSGSGGGPCGACKFLRRKCVNGCIFAPYFDSEQGAAHFAAVHKVFGASNVSKLLLHIPAHKRLDAVVTICYEAQARLRDPVYGCVAHVFALQQQVVNLQAELAYMQAHLATLELPSPPLPPQPPPLLSPPPLSISDLPSASNLPATFDLSTLFDQQAQPSWPLLQQRQMDLRQAHGGGRHIPETSMSSGGGDLQALARELLSRHRSASVSPAEPSISK